MRVGTVSKCWATILCCTCLDYNNVKRTNRRMCCQSLQCQYIVKRGLMDFAMQMTLCFQHYQSHADTGRRKRHFVRSMENDCSALHSGLGHRNSLPRANHCTERSMHNPCIQSCHTAVFVAGLLHTAHEGWVFVCLVVANHAECIRKGCPVTTGVPTMPLEDQLWRNLPFFLLVYGDCY